MPSNACDALGTGDILGYLRSDLKSAKSSLWIIGPWIDAFFAELVINTISKDVMLRVVTRPTSSDHAGFYDHAVAARTCFESRPNTSVKLLPNLHAKVIIIDEQTVYCGSANWYRFSLEESREIVLRGPVYGINGILDEVQVIWDIAINEPLAKKSVKNVATSNGFMREVIDPVAAAKLKEVPGSFVIKKRPHRN